MLNKITSAIGLNVSLGRSAHRKTAPFGFHGGLSLDTNKRALGDNTELCSIISINPPALLTIPLINYRKDSVAPKVQIHEKVKRGQALADNIVSPVSGVVEAIEHCEIIHPGGLRAPCVVIRNDRLDTPINTDTEYRNNKQEQQAVSHDNDNAEAQAKIAHFIAHSTTMLDQAALVGLGGAGFPTAQKLLSSNQDLQTLIINAAECEPEIACDEALMRSSSIQIAYGISALSQLTQCKRCVVAIEDTKTLAIESMRTALDTIDSTAELMIIPTRYPAGAESPLIQNVTGQFIPHNEKPINHGVICINVATTYALWQAINGQPMDSRVVSLGGAEMPNPCNVRVRFGTPVSYVLQQTGNAPADDTIRIRAGGPLSGFDLHSTNVPITAMTNCILAEAALCAPAAQPCIRCDDCADVCPAMLQPQQLYWYTQAAEHDKCEELQLDACIECGCCDLVCPASIKLTETFRFAKSNANYIKAQQQLADDAELRFLDRKNRLEQKEQARQLAIEQRKEKLRSQKKPDREKINAALNRIRSKRHTQKD